MKEFLAKYVDWDVKLYSDHEYDSSDLEQHSSISIFSFYCDKHDFDFNKLISMLHTYINIFVILGLTSFFGNVVAIACLGKKFYKQNNSKTEESKVYEILIFNLCLADLLNAIYLIVYPIAVAKLEMISERFCYILGFICVLPV